MFEIRFYKSKRKAIRLLLICMAFVAISIYDLLAHGTIEPRLLDWFIIFFFGMGITVGIFNLLDTRPQIIINETGIFDRTAGKDFINWNLVNDAYPKDIYRQRFICLVLDEKAIPLLKGNKKMMALSKSLGYQYVNLLIGQLTKKDQSKVEFLVEHLPKADFSEKKELLLEAK